MDQSVTAKLEELQATYTTEAGRSFSHFYCPILFRDEDVPLCKAHIVNEAFPDTSRAWTLQRKDVDNFYGSRFESDFLDIREFEDISPVDILSNNVLSKRFNAKVLVDNEPVEHFFSPTGVPERFTQVQFEGANPSIPFGVKMCPESVLSAKDRNWEIEISRDIRVPALVSVIKAAHLTLFSMLGYRYALRPAGRFVGHDILGKFFMQNLNKPKPDVLKEARPFFRPYIHMARPLLPGSDFQGTITDKWFLFLMCIGSSGAPWATIVFIKTGNIVHGVMMPVFDHPERVATYLDFLKNDHSAIQVASCRFEDEQWKVRPDTQLLIWPKNDVLYE